MRVFTEQKAREGVVGGEKEDCGARSLTLRFMGTAWVRPE